MMWRDFNGSKILAGGKQGQLLGGRDVQDMDALAGVAGEPQETLG
jgi:hypothetical protein